MFGGKSMCGFPDGRTKQNNKKTNKQNKQKPETKRQNRTHENT